MYVSVADGFLKPDRSIRIVCVPYARSETLITFLTALAILVLLETELGAASAIDGASLPGQSHWRPWFLPREPDPLDAPEPKWEERVPQIDIEEVDEASPSGAGDEQESGTP